ncbi:MAG TPA: ParB N-terminal domain-containing protein [Vicinamibacteria bacterium]|nr:ParB N-terminal domain-containing protein [Vicinamibacteria bacterium]
MAQTLKEKKKTKRKAGASRKRLTPRKEQRGVLGDEARLGIEDPSLAPITARVRELGGAAVGAYREPLSGKPILVAVLPIKVVEPTPFQRDLSPTHTKRLAQRIEETGVFLDPLIVVQAPDGRFWTPNGRHRLAAAKVLGLRSVTALVCPDEDLAFRILALNTEKAHNLKDRSLEVIRMARELALRRPRSKETDYESELEEPALITLGIVYQSHGRFAGSPYFSFLRKLDRFQTKTLPKSLLEREGFAARLLEIDESVKEIVEALKKRGFRSPYLRNYVVARINPVRFHRAKKGDTTPPMAMGAALTRMAASAKKFDTSSVREQDLALVAAVSSAE